MDNITSLDRFRVPVGNQEIELQQIAFEAGGVPVLRLRIREHRRFTIFDIDPVTAARWAQVMKTWSDQAIEANRIEANQSAAAELQAEENPGESRL